MKAFRKRKPTNYPVRSSSVNRCVGPPSTHLISICTKAAIRV
ncbi:MAG: hypothetical protein OJF50_000616 [Nitrospira sp.]|nr:hypothetical protein [Nitrospira sp.]